MPALPEAALRHMNERALAHLPDHIVASVTDITAGGHFQATDAVDYFIYDFDAAIPVDRIVIDGFDPTEDRLVFEHFADSVFIGSTTPAPNGLNLYEYPLTAGDDIVHVSYREIHTLQYNGPQDYPTFFATIELGDMTPTQYYQNLTSYSTVQGGVDYLLFTSGDFSL